MNIFAPSNLGVIQKVTMLILTFEMVPGDVYQNYIWKWTENEELDSKFDAVGLDSRIFMMSMGFPFYVFGILLLLLPIALVMAACIYCNKPKPKDEAEAEGGSNEIVQLETESNEKEAGRAENFRNAMMWNSFILFFYEASLEISLSLTVGYKYI
jgi:hypothetical protein